MSDTENHWQALAAPWLAHEAAMEALLAPAGAALDAALGLSSGEAVLDVGPGSGGSLIRHRAAVGATGRVVGVDISPPFAARARARTGEAVVVADAAAAPVEAGRFDALASQFGVMFFADPAAAFAVLGRNLKPGGRAAFVAWGPRSQNPLFALPGQVAADLLDPPEPMDPDAPGPFGLQNASRATRLLTEAGFDEVAVRSVGLTLASGLDAAGFAAVQIDLGPAASRLRDHPDRAALTEPMRAALTAAFAAHETDGVVALPGLVHVFTARWPGPR